MVPLKTYTNTYVHSMPIAGIKRELLLYTNQHYPVQNFDYPN